MYCDHGRDGPEDTQGGEVHHITHHLQDHVRHALQQLHHRLRIVADAGTGHPEEQAEHHDLQHLVGGHRLHDALGEQVCDEVLQGEGLGLADHIGDISAGFKLKSHTGLQHVHQ